MDKLRTLCELVNNYSIGQNFESEFRELLMPEFVENVPSIISLNLILKILERHHFNIEMFNIDNDEHFNTTEEVRTFLIDDNFNFDTDYLDFIKRYTKRGYFINFEINIERSSNHPIIGVMTRFGYRATD